MMKPFCDWRNAVRFYSEASIHNLVIMLCKKKVYLLTLNLQCILRLTLIVVLWRDAQLLVGVLRLNMNMLLKIIYINLHCK
jgi:hypothetical protein